MESQLLGVQYFFSEVLPLAGAHRAWDGPAIDQAVQWATLSHQLFITLTINQSTSSHCICKETDTKPTKLSVNRKSFTYMENENITCKTCGFLDKSNIGFTEGQLEQRKLKEALSTKLHLYGYSFVDMENSMMILLKKLLLNKSLSEEKLDLIRERVPRLFGEQQQRKLWLFVDQVKANRENLNYLMNSYGLLSGTVHNELLRGELLVSLQEALAASQLDEWMETQLTLQKTRRIATAVKTAENSVGNVMESSSQNFLHRILQLVTHMGDKSRTSLQVLKWLTEVHKDSLNKCHALLLNEWLSLYWYKSDIIEPSSRKSSNCFPSTYPSVPGPDSCICVPVSRVLVSLFAALFHACSATLICVEQLDDHSQPKWTRKVTTNACSKSTGNLFLGPSLLSVNNLISFMRGLMGCSNRGRPPCLVMGQTDAAHGAVACPHCDILQIVRRAVCTYMCSPQASLWSHVAHACAVQSLQ